MTHKLEKAPTKQAARSIWLHRLFARGPTRIAFFERVVCIEGASGYEPLDIPFDTIDEIEEERSLLWTRLTIRDLDGVERSVGGLRKGPAALLAAILRGEGARLAEQLRAQLLELDEELRQIFSGERYIRYSEGKRLRERVGKLVSLTRPAVVCLQLTHAAATIRDRFTGWQNVADFEQERNASNESYVRAAIPTVCNAMKTLLKMKPSDEQAAAIATDEETTLVLAGAGTGKTRVITGKVAYLIHNQYVKPKEILVLTFNRDAAEEVRERLSGELSGVDVSTFHAFGRRVVADEMSEAPTISKLATDEAARLETLSQIIDDLIHDPKQEESITEFVAYHSRPYRSLFDFERPSDYWDYVRKNEMRTLSGDKVKSFEELVIANFLTRNGINFEYESPYKVKTASQRYRQYQPDFYLTDYDIYIEHFALDENDLLPHGWLNYGEGVEWKRKIHQENHTQLIETYSWQCKQGILREHLRRKLENHGIQFNPVPLRELLKDLKNTIVSWLARLIATFLRHVKTIGMSISDLRKRASALPEALRNRAFLNLFERVWERYQKLLSEEGAVDFEDLINHATTLIGDNKWPSPYRYVLVDEFQDISAGRMALLKALNGLDVGYFLVGDDWQSIYRFAGSDVGLVQKCGEFLGHMTQRDLTQTFRYGESIIRPSTAFIQRNPQQTKRSLHAASQEVGNGLTIIATADKFLGIRAALTDIEERISDSESPSVLLLGRYKRSRLDIPEKSPGTKLHLEFSTIHSAKGREADYAIVLDLKDALYGFPSQIEDDPLIEFVLNNSSPFPYAEERRLFYVAMTRARRGVYLIPDLAQPSSFVNELRREGSLFRQIGDFESDTAPCCPRCKGGRLVPSQSAKNLRCTNHPFCEHLAKRCERCQKGYLLVLNGVANCSNPSCGAVVQTCPCCSIGVLQRKDSKYGPFWGCSEYRSEPPCHYTRNATPN